MQFSIIKKKKYFIVLSFLITFFILLNYVVERQSRDFKGVLSKLENMKDIKSRNLRGIVGKSMTPFRSQSIFEWIDETQGIGKIRVEIESRSFVTNTWNYQWVLPNNSFTSEMITSSFDSPKFDQTQVFEMEIKGLDSNENQNIFLKLKPFSRGDSAMTIVIPTHSDKTEESKIKKSFVHNEKIQLLRKSLSSQNAQAQSHTRRIQF